MSVSRPFHWWFSIIAVVAVAAALSTVVAGFCALILPDRNFSILLSLLLSGTLLYATFRERSPLFGRTVYRGNHHRHEIALTFDDGPSPPYTDKILDILREKGVIATFFVVGRHVERYPGLARRIIAEGHAIGNHTYTHQVLPLKGPSTIRYEIERAGEIITTVTGNCPTLFRPPHGWRNPFVNPVAKRCGYRLIAWTCGVWDTDCPGKEKIVRRSLDGLRNGCILLLHDGGGDRGQTVEALPMIIDGALQRGYMIVPLERLIGLEAVV